MGNIVGKAAWRGGLERRPCVARSVFPGCCLHCLWRRGGLGREARCCEAGGVGQPLGGTSAACARGAGLPGRGLGGGVGGSGARGRGAARRGRAAGGAVRGAAPERAGPGEERARGRLGAGYPSRGRPPSSPLAGPWRLAVSALRPPRPRAGGGRGARGWEVLLFPTPAFVPGSRERRPGSPHAPGRTPAPLPITLRCLAGLERRRWFWQLAREGCGQRACSDMEGTRRCRGACHRTLWGQCPQAQTQPLGSPATKARRAFGAVSSRFASSLGDLRACLLRIRVA